jgi:hypothetical protein
MPMPDDSKINIVTKEDITVQEITAISIAVEDIILFTSAVIRVTSYNAAGNRIKFDRLTLSGDDYTNWSNNDQYIYNYVYTTMNITPLPTQL